MTTSFYAAAIVGVMEKPLTVAGAIDRAAAFRGWSPRTAQAYTYWMRQYVRYHGRRHPRDLSAREVAAFLSHLATERKVSASTHNQAVAALTRLRIAGCAIIIMRLLCSAP